MVYGMKPANKKAIPQEAILTTQEIDILTAYWHSKANKAFEHGLVMPIKTYMVVSLLLGSGLRINELASLKLDHVHVTTKPYYLMVHGKNDKYREVALPKRLASDLKYYLDWHQLKYPESQYLIPNKTGKRMTKQNVGMIWRNAMKKAGLKPKRPHSARHTFATFFLEKHGNLRALQHQLGHANIVTTSRYLHINLNQIADMVEND